VSEVQDKPSDNRFPRNGPKVPFQKAPPPDKGTLRNKNEGLRAACSTANPHTHDKSSQLSDHLILPFKPGDPLRNMDHFN
jgi:hypothetical protein